MIPSVEENRRDSKAGEDVDVMMLVGFEWGREVLTPALDHEACNCSVHYAALVVKRPL